MKTIKLIVAIAIPLLAGFVGSAFTTPNITTWYASLGRPFLSPPNWIFAPVWTTLFVLMGISLFLVWTNKSNQKLKREYFIFFAVQMILNVLWSVLFFSLHLLFWSVIEIIALAISIFTLIVIAKKISKNASWLLVPYLLWVSFASYLTISFWLLNK